MNKQYFGQEHLDKLSRYMNVSNNLKSEVADLMSERKEWFLDTTKKYITQLQSENLNKRERHQRLTMLNRIFKQIDSIMWKVEILESVKVEKLIITNQMTVKEKIMGMLEDMGMFPSQAEAVLELAILELDKNTGLNWTDKADAYPPLIYNIALGLIKPIALEWIEQNIPQAWFKPMFK
jgi:hypothetical protein